MTKVPNNRPPAIAQQRFAARRAEFAELDLARRFERIHETNLWGADTSVSGVGSELAATAAIRERLPALLQERGVRSMLDAPCGDHRWMASVALDLDLYVGMESCRRSSKACSSATGATRGVASCSAT